MNNSYLNRKHNEEIERKFLKGVPQKLFIAYILSLVFTAAVLTILFIIFMKCNS